MTLLLLNHAVKACLLLLGGMVAVRVLASHSAALRHLVWTLVMTAVLLLLPLAWVLPELHLGLVRAAPANLAAERATDLLSIASDPLDLLDDGSNAPHPAPGEAATVAARRWPAQALAVLLWVGVALLLLCRLAAGQLALARFRRQASPVADLRARGLAREAARTAGVRRPVELLVTHAIATPVTFGFVRPVVMLPAEALDWPEERLGPALLHEYAHVRRLDCLTQLLAEVVCALHWFNPLAWYAAGRMLAERERACDDEVLRCGISSTGYASFLLEAARALVRQHALPAGAVAMARATELEDRLRAILSPAITRGRPAPSLRLGVAAMIGLVAIALAVVEAAAAPEGDSVIPADARPPARESPRSASGSAEVLPPVNDALALTRMTPAAGDSLDDPLSELLPVADPRVRWPTAEEIRTARDREAILRLRTAAEHVKAWEGDLVRERAEWALAQVQSGEIVAPLVRALADPDWRVQAYAAWALAVTQDPRAVEPLGRLLEHPNWRVRAQTVYSLLQLGAPLPEGQLAPLAADPAWQVRIGVVAHLEHAGGAAARRRLERMLQDPHAGTRMAVEKALAEHPERH